MVQALSPTRRRSALDNVVATPHTAFYSEESVADLARLAAKNVADVLAGRRPASVVNPSVLCQLRPIRLDTCPKEDQT